MDFDEEALQIVRETRLLIDQYDAWLYDEFTPYVGQRIIEVGCGLGNLLRHLASREMVVGIEPSAETVVEVQRAFANTPSVRIVCGSITDPSILSLSDYGFDTAISLNVFEHIDDDELAMANTHDLLQPQGRFVLIVPAHAWLYGTMDRSIGHYRRYTKRMLSEKMARAGFEMVQLKYINLLGALGWWLNGRLLHRSVPPVGQLELFNRIVPGLRAIEGLGEVPFGISVMAVGKRNN